MGTSNANNSEELQQQEQPTETQDGLAQEQPGGEDSSQEWDFTDVRLTDVNRDDLSPEMQKAYDTLLEQGNSMQGDYTRKTQDVASIRRDADYWRTVQQHPELAGMLNDAIYNLQHNLPLTQDAGTPAEKATEAAQIDPNTNPEGYMRNLVQEAVSGEINTLRDEIKGLMGGVQEVTGHMRSNQSQLEFDNLVNQYPAAKAIGMEELQRVRNQYQNNGRPISMMEALSLKAMEQPSVLGKGKPTQPKRPVVEKPGQTKTGGTDITLPPGVRDMIKKARELDEEGADQTLLGAARRALLNFRGKTP